MIILGKDYETTGLDPKVSSVTEVGMILWDTDTSSPIKVLGFLVDPGPEAVWDPLAIKKTLITPQLCSKYGYQNERALKQVLSWYQDADVICAHNGNRFDKPLFLAWCSKFGFTPPDKSWIDTNTDIELDELEHSKSRKLPYMAADHGFLNPFPHRAVFDVMTMLRILSGYDLERVLFLARQPNIQIQAIVSYEDKDLAKARGYRWEPDPRNPNGKNIWTQSIKECFLEKERKEAGFPIGVVTS